MDLVYHTIIAVALLAAAPVWLLRAAVSADFRRELTGRLTGWRRLWPPAGCLWLHAASVGEVRLALTLIRSIKETLPGQAPVLSTFTATGLQTAREAGLCDVFLMPPDSAVFLGPLLGRLKPAALVLIEAELWPGLLRLCNARGVPVLLLNGRMSETSYLRYSKIRTVFQWMTQGIFYFAMRTEDDARRVKRLGVADCRVGVTGNMKFDAAAEGVSRVAAPPEEVVVFGSTRPGDEEPALDAIARLQEAHPSLKFVLAPRHLERVAEVADLLRRRGLEFALHSNPAAANGAPRITLVDKMGVLNDYYRRAQVAFVGGGFRPEFGGQNILEPALWGVPVVYGPHMQNFEEEARLLTESGGGIQLESPDQLYPMLRFLLEHPAERARLGQQAAEAVAGRRGAVGRNLEILRETLKFAAAP